jgi:hypothetical protein
MNLSGSPIPVTAYTIPPAAPEDVAAAHADFQRVASLFEDARDDLRDARHAVTAAKARDVSAIVEATKEGKEQKDPQQHEREAQEKVERLQALLGGLSRALDEAGNELVDAIATHRDEWASSLSEFESEAAERFDTAIEDAKRALSVLVPSRGGSQWLRNFNASHAKTGEYSGFSGGRVRVSGRRIGVPEIREIDPAKLLLVAGQASVETKRAKEVEVSV